MAISDINTGKELAAAYRPVVFVDFLFPDGATLYVASIAATFNGHTYDARIDDQQIDRISSLSEQGIDRVPSVTIVLADPSGSVFASYERGHGFKGASMTLRFALYDPPSGNFTTDNFVPFVGVCDQPSIDGKNLTVSAQSKLNFSQFMLPTAPIQVRCIWINPTTVAQRAGADDAASLYYPCGETRDLTTAPPCAYTKQTCTRPNRYSGSTWAPGQTDAGENYISGKWDSWRNADTSGKYKEYWPVWLGGIAWMQCVPLNQFGDGNYTRGEVAVGIGEVAVSRVIANGIELSQGGKDYFWAYTNLGYRDGTPNADSGYNGQGDPYGGLTVIEYRAPKTVISPETAATVMVLGEKAVNGHTVAPSSIEIASVQAGINGNPSPIIIHFGRVLGTYDPGDQSAITITGCSWAPANGSWTMELLDQPYDHATLRGSMAYGSGGACTAYYNQLTQSGGGVTPGLIQETLRQCGITNDEISAPMMAVADAICNATVTTTDGSGATYGQNRFTSAVAVRQRRSAADIVRGLRQSIGALLTVDQAGLIGLRVEGPLAEQQSAPVDGSNNATPISSILRDGSSANGYTAYRFDESTAWNLKRDPQQVAQMPNRVTFSFQDPVQEFAISSFSLVDSDDIARIGREVPGGLQVNPEGIASYNHALRCARLGLNKIHRGNPAGDTRGTDWWEWTSSFRACKLRVGDIITLNNTLYSLTEQMVRLTEIKPSKNFETVALKGHYHDDTWYLDSHGNAADPARGAAPYAGLGACVPPSFAVEVSALDPTVAEVTGLTFTNPINTYSTQSGTFTFYFVIEASILTTLAATITDPAAASISVVDASQIAAGDYLQIGGEVVLCGAPAGGLVPVTRGQLATTAATALNGASVWKVQQKVTTVSFPLDFVNSAAIADWALMQPLPDTKLLAVGGSVTNAYGSSEVSWAALTNNSDHGMKLYAPAGAGTTQEVINPAANTDYSILAGYTTVNVVATTRVVIVTLPPEAPNRGGIVVVNRAVGSLFDVHVVPASLDDIDSSSTAVEVLTASSPTWAGFAV
jgi:hypothetical protein